MSLSAQAMWEYFQLLLNYKDSQIEEMKQLHPMEAKKALAESLTSLFFDNSIAKKEGEDETGGKDETEDAMVRAGLMANAVRFKTIDLDNVPEEYKEMVESDLKEQKKKEEELKKTLEEAPTR